MYPPAMVNHHDNQTVKSNTSKRGQKATTETNTNASNTGTFRKIIMTEYSNNDGDVMMDDSM